MIRQVQADEADEKSLETGSQEGEGDNGEEQKTVGDA